MLGDIACAGNQAAAAFHGAVACGQGFGGEINHTIARGLQADLAAAPVKAPAGDDRGVLAALFAIGAE